VHGQGLGRKMTLGAIGKIAADTRKVSVCTRRINEQAKDFYKALGFTDSDMEKVHPQLPAYKYQGFELLLKD
jgi:ribosomal protein S18 acetylase RimI-like enzyme